MNRFSEIVKESNSFEELEDHIIPISDVLGKPSIATLKFGDKDGYVFKWNLKFNIEEYNGSKEISDIVQVFESVKTLTNAMKRIEGYDVEFKIDYGFFVRLTPHTQSDGGDYKFIVGQNWRNIILDYGQIAKFFKDQGYSIRNTKIEDNEYEETSSVYIITDAPDYVTSQFKEKMESEIDLLYNQEETINRKINCTNNGGMVYVFPEEEKTFVIFNQQV
jgi:hypothetical protein